MLRNKARSCRPRAHIAYQLLERALAGQREFWGGNLLERERNRGVSVENELPFGQPIALDCSPVEAMQYLLELRFIQHRVAITPDSDRSSQVENPLCLGEKCFAVEPVERLSDGYKIDGFVG